MTINVGINGFGRIGRLSLRAFYDWSTSIETSASPSGLIQFVHINEPSGDANTMAHLMNFDSVHGRFKHEAKADGDGIKIDSKTISFSQNRRIQDTDWSQCDIVLEASGKFKSIHALQPYFEQGVKKVVVCAPIKEDGALNIVMGVNDSLYEPSKHHIVTAASCTTNCLAPALAVVHERLGIKHGSITTIHDITNTQTIIDAPHKDLRRARSCGSSLIPTTTGSATAITEIFPELKGKLNGHAVRVPLTNASLTDCVFELQTPTSVDKVNALLKDASEGSLCGIMGYEERPLVSVDYKTDPRSCIVDAPSTMVINNTQLKLYLWYDNEWGYSNRAAELVRKVAIAGWPT